MFLSYASEVKSTVGTSFPWVSSQQASSQEEVRPSLLSYFYEWPIASNPTITKPFEMSEIEKQIEREVLSLANTLAKGKTHYVEAYSDEHFGLIVKVTTELSAKEALELWKKLVKQLKRGNLNVFVTVEWRGEENIPEDKQIDFMVEIMLESGVGPVALPGFDAVRIVQEQRER